MKKNQFYTSAQLVFFICCLTQFNICSSQSGFGTSLLKQDAELEINVEDTIILRGNLVFSGAEKLVIFIAGSGPTDRDCNNSMGLKTDAFKMLADSLKNHGISSFRYDKRGIAGSTKVPESSMTMEMFVSDASTVVDYFSQDFEEIYIIGHSEGALIGSIVSHQNFNVYALIALCGTSVSLDSIVMDQLAKYPKLLVLAKKHIEEIKTGQPLSEVNPMLLSLFRESVVPFLRSAFAMDPMREMAKVEKKVLIIGGSCDQQVPTNHAENLHLAKPSSELLLIDQMGHTLKIVSPECKNDRNSYMDPSMAIHPELLSGLVRFING